MPHRGRNAVVWGTRGEKEYGHVIDMWQFSESSNVSAVWEVMSMLKAYHLLFRDGKFINGNGAYGHGRWNPDDSNPPARQLISGSTREVTMLSFGVFGIETISMPADVDSKYDNLIANPAAMLQESANAILGEDGTATNVDIFTIQDEIFRKSGFPNHNDNHPMAPLSFKLFEFTLRAHFNLQFHITTFNNDINYAKEREELWDAFCDTAVTFHRADSTVTRYGFEILEPYRPRILSYSQLE